MGPCDRPEFTVKGLLPAGVGTVSAAGTLLAGAPWWIVLTVILASLLYLLMRGLVRALYAFVDRVWPQDSEHRLNAMLAYRPARSDTGGPPTAPTPAVPDRPPTGRAAIPGARHPGGGQSRTSHRRPRGGRRTGP